MAIAKWAWKETAVVLGVVGIIAGIVFLGFELRQNNQLLVEEARYNNLSERIRGNELMLANPELNKLLNFPPDEPSEEELALRATLIRKTLLIWQWEYQLDESGVYSWASSDSALRDTWREVFRKNQYIDAWESEKYQFDPAFIDWMEENVVNER